MSWLLFNRTKGTLSLYEDNHPDNKVAIPTHTWVAHNNTTKTSKGPWPNGTWTWTHYNAHPEMGKGSKCHNTAYGCTGVHVFEVKGRTGMGVHSGRTDGSDDKVGGKTLGCVRAPTNAMQTINEVHRTNPIVAIVVRD